MRGAKFFGIVMACVLALLLAGQAGFIPDAWAKRPNSPGQDKKPPHRRGYRTEYGYAMLRDGVDDVIKSDGGGQYVDREIGGQDRVEIDIYSDDNTLKSVSVYCGKMTYEDGFTSSRRVRFCFDIHGGTPTPACEDNRAVYNILSEWRDPGSGQYSLRGFLDDNTIHAPILIYADEGGLKDMVRFVVDPGSDGADPRAITQNAVDVFYDDDKNVDYWDTSECDEAGGQIIYTLYYGDNGFKIDPVDRDEDGDPDTWIFTSQDREPGNPVRLGVGTSIGKEGGWAHKVVHLSEYADGLPFQLVVSLNDLSTYPAPGKHNTLSTLWGKIKAK